MLMSAFYYAKFDGLGPVIAKKDATGQPRGSATWKPRGKKADVAGATWHGATWQTCHVSLCDWQNLPTGH